MDLRRKQRLDYYVGATLLALLKPVVMALGKVLRRDHERTVRGPIVVFKLQGGGSLVLAAPALHAIRDHYPDERFTLVTTPSVKPFGESLHLFDTIYSLDDRTLLTMIRSACRILWALRGTDTVIDLEVYSRLTGVFGLLTLARNRIGFFLEHTFWRRGIYTHLVFFNRHYPVPFFYARTAAVLGAQPLGRAATATRMALTPIVADSTDAPRRPFIAIGAGCSEMATERRMDPAGWVHFLRPVLMADPEVELVLLGAAADRPVAQAIIEVLRLELGFTRTLNACGTLSLMDSLLVLRAARHFFGIDSALLHYARLAGLPTTSFWGPVSPAQRLTPWDDVVDTAHYFPMPCSPCVHVAETPPCHGDNMCMRCLYDDEARVRLPEWIDQHRPWNHVR